MDNSDKFTYGLIFLIFILSVMAFREFIGVIIVSGSFAAVLMPAHRYMCRYARPEYSSFIITFLVGFLVIVTLYVAASVIYQNGDYIVDMISSIVSWINLKIFPEMSVFMETPPDMIYSLFSDLTLSFKESALEYLTLMPIMTIKIMIMFLSLFLFLVYGDKIIEEIKGIIPCNCLDDISILKKSVSDMLYAIFNVHLAVAVVVFLVSFPVFYLLGYGHILFFAVVSGILALIPVFGPVFLIAFLALYAASISDWGGLFIILIFAWPLLCAIPDWWMRPVLMGKRASVNAVLMFIAFFGGIAAMGLLGFIMGPIFVALMLAGYRILIEKSKKNA